MKLNSFGFNLAVAGISFFLGWMVHFTVSWETPINTEERTNEILAMDATDVIDEFIPVIWKALDRISEETTDAIVRTAIGVFRPYFEEVGKTAYLQGYRDGSQGISGDIPADN